MLKITISATELIGKTEKVSFSSGSGIRRADLLRKRVPNRRDGICERHLTIGYCTDIYVFLWPMRRSERQGGELVDRQL